MEGNPWRWLLAVEGDNAGVLETEGKKIRESLSLRRQASDDLLPPSLREWLNKASQAQPVGYMIGHGPRLWRGSLERMPSLRVSL